MAYPSDSTDPRARDPAPRDDQSTEELERLAATFRPSWQLDDAPFTGGARFSAEAVRSLEGAEMRGQVKAAMETSNGAKRPPKPVAFQQPPSTVIIEPTPDARPVGKGRASATLVGMSTAPVASDAQFKSTLVIPGRRSAPPAPLAAQWQPPQAADAADDSPFPKRSRKPLWIGVGACLAGAIGIGAWAMSSGTAPAPQPPARAASAARPPAEQPRVETATIPPPSRPDNSAAMLPPQPEVVAATPPSRPEGATAALPGHAENARAASPAVASAPIGAQGTTRGSPPSPPAAALPPLPHPVATPAPPPPLHGAAPKPASRPKAASTTIVHEVPF